MSETAETRRSRAIRTNVPTNILKVALMIIDEDHDDADPEPWKTIPSWLLDLFKQKPVISRSSHGAFCTCSRC